MKIQRKIIPVLVLILILSFIVLGCSTTAATTSATKSTTAQITQATTSAAQPAAQAAKTLKIATNLNLSWTLGLDQLHATQLDIDKVNADGGLDIGGTKYTIDLIVDDNKADDSVAKSSAQKEIFQDKVGFILGDIWCVSSYMNLCESNDVVLFAWPSSDIERSPDIKHTYHITITDTNFEVPIAYIKQAMPELKTFLAICTDDEEGRGYAPKIATFAQNSGFEVMDAILFPANSTDLSAVGTKIKTLNPDAIGALGGGPQTGAQIYKAAYNAGWRGQIIGCATSPAETLIGIAGAEPVEGFISLAWPAEFEPATHPLAASWKADYIAKFGKWDNPEIIGSLGWWVLKEALQQAGSTEPAKVRAVLDNGMKFDSIGGSGQLVSRPDFGVTRTMEVILGDMPMKQIKGGQVSLYDTLSLEESQTLWRQGKGIK